MAYDPYGEMFYGTLPQDTQDFSQVLSGVGRSLREIGRSTQYLPYDVLGAPVDLATLAMRPFGYQTQTPTGGSDWLIELARQYGLADKPTGSGIETATRLATGITSPTAVPRAIGKFAQGLDRASDITTEQANRAADALVRQITGNPTATAQQVIQETSMPFMQAVAPKAPSLLEAPVRSDLGFYSALEQATAPLQNKGTGQQFLAQIEKTAGVKPEEIKWTGLDDFLKSKPTVTKQEVQDYLAANRVDLQEVQLGGPQAFNEARLFQLEDEFSKLKQHPIDDPNFGEAKYDEMIRLMNIRDQSTTSDLYRQADNAMILAQRAQARGAQRAAENLFRKYELLNTRAEKLDLQDMGMANPPKFSQYTIPGGENYREILLTLPQKTEKGFMTPNGAFFSEADLANPIVKATAEKIGLSPAFRNVGDSYKSSHFDQPNILAHMRVNDRIVDGKKTLFIEEVQSDWHQAGRKKGYQQPKGTLPEGFKVTKEMNSDNQPVWVVRDKSGESVGFGANEQEALNSLRTTGVPDAPFKTSWHELSLKRAIQEASEKGYDKIAFTTGKTQAERYDLSKQVDSLLYTKNADGTYRVSAQVQGRGQMLGEAIPESDLADYVGKEVAEKMSKGTGKQTQVAGEYDPVSMTSGTKTMTELSGEGLKVGGEGMKGFYDQILPKSLEKLGKKFDAKVTKTTMKAGQDVTEPGIVAPGIGMEFSGKTTKAPEIEVWSMDITPKMRESVLTKGQPLFAATPALPALGLLGGEEE